ncbi:MAG: dihydrodipicolinate synthase family protein [Pseudomonadota bacterium]|nr:dihydrodipicolinate synthase family protein [Pseudomonadota bacterium]
MLTVNDMKGLYAITQTPSLGNVTDYDADNTVDLTALEALLNRLIDDKVQGIILFGTTGEMATLTPEEWRGAAACAAEVVNRRIPLFIGATAPGTRETVQRMRYAKDLAADGTMLGMPNWQPCTLPMALQHYADCSAAVPDFAIIAYENSNAFRFDYPIPFWVALTQQAPTVIAAKNGVDLMLNTLVRATAGKIRFLPHVGFAYAAARINPDHLQAVWATEAAMGPAPAQALTNAILKGDWERAAQIDAEVNWALQTFFPPGGFGEFAHYNIQLEKIRFDEAGYSRAGPIRPPYDHLPDTYVERARECGRRWAKLQKKYG